MTRVSRSLLAVAMIVAPMVIAPAGSAPITGDGRRATLYLHSDAPVGTAQQVEPLIDPTLPGPTMDETAPTAATPKVASSTGLGNEDYRKNFLVGFWSAQVHGRVSDANAKIWLTVRGLANVNVTLFGDGGVGTGRVMGRATGQVSGNGPVLLDLGLPVDASVNEELVLSVQVAERPSAILHDSIDYPSSLSFDLNAYVPPPPFGIGFPPSAGWDAVSPVSLQKAHRESSLAVNPVNEDEMLVCDPSGVPSTGEGHSYFHVTHDGGVNWSDLELEPPGDTRRLAYEGGDCDVAYDAVGTMYTADTWLGNLSVGSSNDGGTTWTGTPIAVQAPIVDRPWLVGGRRGRCTSRIRTCSSGCPV